MTDNEQMFNINIENNKGDHFSYQIYVTSGSNFLFHESSNDIQTFVSSHIIVIWNGIELNIISMILIYSKYII